MQIGEREGRDVDIAWPDLNNTTITRLYVFTTRGLASAEVIARTLATLGNGRIGLSGSILTSTSPTKR